MKRNLKEKKSTSGDENPIMILITKDEYDNLKKEAGANKNELTIKWEQHIVFRFNEEFLEWYRDPMCVTFGHPLQYTYSNNGVIMPSDNVREALDKITQNTIDVICEKNKEELQRQLDLIKKEVEKYDKFVKSEDSNCSLIKTYNKLPWYKKIFKNKIENLF